MRKLVQTLPGIDHPTRQQNSPLGKDKSHESAVRQVSGQARYVDDMPEPANIGYVALGTSECAAGKIESIDLDAVRNSDGVIDVITIHDIPGHTDIAPVFDGDPVLAENDILFYGQPVYAVLANTTEQARSAAAKGVITVSDGSPTLTVDDALAKQSFVRPTHVIGNESAIETVSGAAHQLSGSLFVGGQEHMYLEGQVSMAIPEEEDRMMIYTSSQHPSEVQKLVAEVLGTKLHRVTVDMRRMGGGFGGKESQAAQWACIAAVLAQRNGLAVKCRLPRSLDMSVTGKRHPFENSWRIGFDENGMIQGADITVNGNCGYSADLSDAIVDRAMFHVDNGYFLGDSHVVGHRLKTSYVSHTAYRGFGGPQGMIVAEAMMDGIARKLGEDPLTIRKRNLYGETTGNTTPYGMDVGFNLLPDMISKLEASADFWQRRETITAFNKSSPIIKKGLAMTPVKFGISFTAKHLNQAGALIHIYTDGSIQVNHGGTEMGQGLHTKIAQIAAHEFGVDTADIEVTSTRTDKVPNTSPTAASSGTDLNGKAVQNACITLKERLIEFWAAECGVSSDGAKFENYQLTIGEHTIDFPALIQAAYLGRISLSSTGYYRTPKIYYDRETGTGRPFFYFAYGVAASEVSIDTLTGEYKVEKVDILHDVGASLNPAIDVGQIEGGFIQGMGWLTSEELKWDDHGRLTSNNMATYKIPAIGDTPAEMNVSLYRRPNDEDSIYHSKAVGEPPFMLAISVWCALKDAIASLDDYQTDPYLPTPATPEKVLDAVMAMQAKSGSNAA
ncbi:xanthine dehydrogenase molybdopterin binding subunit [Alteromonas confluentis]|uniref:Xanthine dehydrogenase molybdopterin binding subunit n=1 Tax=Alteromonas confluentis TaxID=1656094 RepID=A0A1E7ZFT0_9ALTE|nr:xanthine dehydrogenase molybdopterin binding subunit [Alteromonas confluentis]OFC72378.1 xanthine dehydrogenase molybdopterin binding subunit [Alteromonas confluentis]